ncbi:MAG TPA: glycosyltransferase [Steroidobacteraceae bacterium]
MRTGSSRCVALLRHQLFKPSEVFITEQARALRRFHPLLVGRSVAGTPCADVRYHVPASGTSLKTLNYVLRRDPSLFLPELKRHQPALVHAHFGVEAVYGMEIAERLGVPLVTTFHGFDATLSTPRLLAARKASWVNYVLKRKELAQRGALFICVSEFIRRKLLELGFPESLTRVHYIGVDTAAFEASRPDPDNPIILHVARLVEKKGTEYLLEAFAKIAGKHPQAQLIIIGDGPLRHRLMRQTAELGIEEQVAWMGTAPNWVVREWLLRTSIFCLPSCTAEDGDSEGLPISILEAAASGVPVVATQHAGIPEAVRDGSTGLLVSERDSRSLAEALDALLSSETHRRAFGRHARSFMRERFDLFRQTRQLEALYEEVL